MSHPCEIYPYASISMNSNQGIAMLRAGVAEIVITPPIGVELQGYGVDLSRRSTDVHDDLMAQALVLDDGQTRTAIITADLMGVSVEFTRLVASSKSRRKQEILLPNVMLRVRTRILRQEHYRIAILARSMPNTRVYWCVISLARWQRRQGNLNLSDYLSGAATMRRCPEDRLGRDIVDPSIAVARLERESGDTLALLVHYACHPVMLGPKSEISADYPWALRQYLKNKHPGSVVLFMNGTCGDIDPASNRTVWGKATFAGCDAGGCGAG